MGSDYVVMENTIIQDRSFKFAIRIENLYKYLCQNAQGYVLSKQLLRTPTSNL